jgi:DNA polymerase III gamma/tau subunit
MSFDTKYRPLLFQDVVGQQGTVQMLKNILKSNKVFQKSYIFAGPSGTGKTTTARILARAMLCDNVSVEGEPCNTCQSCQEIINGTSSFNFVEMDAANNSGVDTIRGIVENSDYYTLGGKDRRIYLIDECFTEDTQIKTEEGLRSIKDVVETKYSGKVLSFDTTLNQNVWKTITDWFDIPDKRDVIQLTFDTGVEITTTLNQDIYTFNRGWVKACDLVELDNICTTPLTLFDDSKNKALKQGTLVKSKRLGTRKVYDITVEDTHNFFATSAFGNQNHSVLVHNCHRLSLQSMDALLKPMEESRANGDKRLVCLFCTTEPEKMRDTIKARCLTFGIREPLKKDVVDRLEFIAQAEGLSYEREALDLIFAHGRGHIRDMVTSLERVSSVGAVDVATVRSQLGFDSQSLYFKILQNLGVDLEAAMKLVQEVLPKVGSPGLYKGLAEACLASYRTSLGLDVGMETTDVDDAREVFCTHGEVLLTVASRILEGNPKIDRPQLLCEILMIHRFFSVGSFVSLPSNPNPVGNKVNTVEAPQEASIPVKRIKPKTPESTGELTLDPTDQNTLMAAGRDAQNFVRPGKRLDRSMEVEETPRTPTQVNKTPVRPVSDQDVAHTWSLFDD